MADQTIEIRLILRDELSRQLAPINAQLKQIQSTRIDAMHNAFQRFAPVVRVVHRELSSLSRLTLGGLVGGGVVAGIATAVRALNDMARQQIQLHYAAQQFGVSVKFIENYRDALTGLGEAPEAAAASIKQALATLDEFQAMGEKSSLGSFLEKAIGGPRLARELHGVIEKHGQEAGLPFAAKDIAEILPLLGKRVQLNTEQMKALQLANLQWQRSSENISKILGAELTPAVAKVMKALSDYLQTESGKKFAKDIGDIAKSISDSISEWIEKGGLKDTLDTLKWAFEGADAVIKAMGLTWPKVIIGLALGRFALQLLAVARGIRAILSISGAAAVIAFAIWLAKRFGEPATKEMLEKHPGRLEDMPGLTDEQRENLKKLPQRYIMPKPGAADSFWQSIYNWMMDKLRSEAQPQPQQQSGEGKPQNEQERKAAQAADERERDALNRELAELAIGTGHLADYLGQTAIGGPEGGFGQSGYQNDPLGGDLSRSAYDTMFKTGPMAGKYDAIVAAAAKQDLSPSLLAGIMALESKAPKGGPFGMSNATLKYLNPGGLMMGPQMKQFQSFPNIEAGIDKTAAIIARNLQKGGGTFEGLAEEYSPSKDPKTGRPYANDYYGTNRLWPSLVGKFTRQLTDPGQDPGGLQDAVPYTGGSAAADETGASSITQYLARQQDLSLSGSATIDIDVGGLASSRNPSLLFKPQPLDGATQMQNAQHVPDNRLSFQ